MTIHLHALSIGTRGVLPLSSNRGLQLGTFGVIAPNYRLPVAEYRIIAPYRQDRVVVPYRKDRVVVQVTNSNIVSSMPVYDSIVGSYSLANLVSLYTLDRLSVKKE